MVKNGKDRTTTRRAAMAACALALLSSTGAAAAPDACLCLGENQPLPLAVSTPQDIAFKALAERQYLTANLLTAGRVAWGSASPSCARWWSSMAAR